MRLPCSSGPLAYSPDGTILAMGVDANAEIVLYSIATAERKAIPHGYEELPALAFSPNGQILASGGLKQNPRSRGGIELEEVAGLITLWNLKTHKK